MMNSKKWDNMLRYATKRLGRPLTCDEKTSLRACWDAKHPKVKMPMRGRLIASGATALLVKLACLLAFSPTSALHSGEQCVYAPDGTLGAIPVSKVDDAKLQGYTILDNAVCSK
jgi:hypothetical protein